MEKRIKCGKCSSEYFPREEKLTNKIDYSCPVCAHGSVKESCEKPKSMLLDHRSIYS